MKKWFILIAYSIVVATSQMLWLTFSPVTTQSATIMSTSVNNVTILSLVFPLTYIILAVPMSHWLDRNFARAITVGSLLTGIGGISRLLLPFNFDYQLAVQIFISLGQPLILGSLSIVAVYYFEEKERPTAISVGSLAIFIGIIVATAGGLFLYDKLGYMYMLGIEAVPGAIGMIMLPIYLRSSKITGVSVTQPGKFRYSHIHFKLAAMLFVGMGIFDALDTWLQPMLSLYGLGGSAGNLIALMTLMGIFGAAILPKPVSERKKRRLAISVIIGVSFLSLGILGFVNNLVFISASLALEGFFLLAGLPILIEWGEKATPAQFQGRVTSLLMLAGNLGGLVLIALGDFTYGFGNPVTAIGMIAFVVVLIPVLLVTPTTVGIPKTETVLAGE